MAGGILLEWPLEIPSYVFGVERRLTVVENGRESNTVTSLWKSPSLSIGKKLIEPIGLRTIIFTAHLLAFRENPSVLPRPLESL